MTGESHISYDFLAPRKIVFGWGRRSELGSLGRTLGRRAFIICGSRTLAANGTMDEMTALLQDEGVEAINIATISHEPEVEDVDRIAGQLRSRAVKEGDFLIAVGGGAAIDLAKAVAAMATDRQSDTVKDYLENVGKNLVITEPPLATLAVPTTAGTGCEATKNAVISSYDPPFKKSLRDERLVPSIALVDPELTISTPPSITAASGMDAITQLIESYISLKTQPIPRALALQGLMMGIPAIVEAVENGSSRPARENMAHAALLSGICLANSGLGFAHGVAPALGVHCRVPHGVACALMLPV
ncbi:MAG: iron-containing alcohol dehydrogenase, partial [Pirellulales bacterium]|nr:iron-containing alcohol dehydrogenase [Pirellulales bacterium]